MSDAVEEFNRKFPIGTPVLYWPGSRKEHGFQSVTRTTAWYIGNQPCVSVSGYPGGISLSHIDVIDVEQIEYQQALL